MPLSAPAAPPKQPARPAEDDELPGALPPLDGDADEREPGPEGLDDEDVPKDDGGDPFDDATGEGDEAPELLGLDDEKGSVLDAGASSELDIGPADLLGDLGESAVDEGKDDSLPLEDYGLDDRELAGVGDAGEEGPSTLDESLSDAGLPPLDQDDDGALDDASSFFDGELAGSRPGAWSPLWERFGAPLSLPPTRALALGRSGVVAAGRELVRVDLEGGVERLAAKGLRGRELTRVLSVGDELFVTTDGGGLFVSRDGGASFAELSSWCALVRPEEAAAGLDVVGSAEAGLWGRTAQGALLSSRDGGEAWTKTDVDGFARALGLDGDGRPVVLVRTLAASEVLRRVGEGWAPSAVPAELLDRGLTGAASIVARGKAVAIAIEGEGVVRALDGAAWSRLPGTSAVTAIAMLDAEGALVAALNGGEGDPQCSLLRVGADARPEVVAVWEERSDGEAGVTAIAVDDAHQVVWVGGGFGVAAFQPRMQ